MHFVDKAFARRLESVEEMPQVMYARMFQKTRPEIGAAEEEICGGHMIFAGLGSPIGRATGAGLDRPFTKEDIDRIEQFYREHKAPSQVDLCPMHEPTVFEMFKDRGYAIAELNNVLYRKLDTEEKFPPAPAGCEIRRSLLDEAETAGAIVESAFFPDGAPEAYRGLIAPFYQMERALAFVASVQGKLVACGAGPCDSAAQGLRTLRRRNSSRLSRTWPADGVAARSHGRRRRSRMRVRSRSHARRHNLATQCRALRLSVGVQQSNGD